MIFILLENKSYQTREGERERETIYTCVGRMSTTVEKKQLFEVDYHLEGLEAPFGVDGKTTILDGVSNSARRYGSYGAPLGHRALRNLRYVVVGMLRDPHFTTGIGLTRSDRNNEIALYMGFCSSKAPYEESCFLFPLNIGGSKDWTNLSLPTAHPSPCVPFLETFQPTAFPFHLFAGAPSTSDTEKSYGSWKRALSLTEARILANAIKIMRSDHEYNLERVDLELGGGADAIGLRFDPCCGFQCHIYFPIAVIDT
jgi:hypothetical protein